MKPSESILNYAKKFKEKTVLPSTAMFQAILKHLDEEYEKNNQ